MMRRNAQHDLFGHGLVIGEDRRHERALAHLCQFDRLAKIVIRQHGRDRAEGLDLMHGLRGKGLVGVQQTRVQERTRARIARGKAHLVGIARDDLGHSLKIADPLAHLFALIERGQRPHPRTLGVRQAKRGLAQTITQRLDERRNLCARRDDTADRGAFLPGLHRHLARDLLDEKIELRRARDRIGAKDRGVQTVGLHREAYRVCDHRRMRLELASRPGRAGKGDRVLPRQVIEHIAHRTADKLKSALGQDARLDDAPHHKLGQIGRLAGGFDYAGHTGQQRRRDLFQHPPDGEVEGVDMHRDALQGRQDVLRAETAILRKQLQIAIGQDAGVGQLAPPFRGEGQHGADAALDVDPTVRARGAGAIAFVVELFLALHQREAKRLEHPGTLMERHRAQLRPGGLAAMRQNIREIQPARIDIGNRRAGCRIQQLLAFFLAGSPGSTDIAFETARGAGRGVHGRFLYAF